MTTENAEPAAPAAPRVAFGPKDHQTLELEVASMLLTLWRERQAPQFGAYLAEVMTGARPAASRERKAKP